MPNPPKEIMALAQHQMEIFDRRFPNYECQIYVFGQLCMIIASGRYCLLQISFRPSSVEIILSFRDEDQSEGEEAIEEERITLDYTDPKFTDDTISDMIKEWEVAHPPESYLTNY